MEGVTEKYKNEMGSLMDEIYQAYKSSVNGSNNLSDVSVELLWVTEGVQNQPYNAQIRLFVLVRAIDQSLDKAKELVEAIISMFTSTLTLQKYDFCEVEYENIIRVLNNVDFSSAKAVVKEEKIENMQNMVMPVCYGFDKLPSTKSDLSHIVGVLINYANCAVSMQLMPTYYALNEMTEIDRITQTLNTLSRGVMDHGVGNISFALTEQYSNLYKYYSQQKSSALFSFNIVVYGGNTAVTNISSRIIGQLSNGTE